MLKEKVIQMNSKKEFKKYRDEDIALLLKLIVLDGVTDLEEIEAKVVPVKSTIERYLGSKEIMMNYLTEEEYNEYLIYYNNLNKKKKEQKQENKKEENKKEEKNKEKENTKRVILSNLVSDIMGSRLSKDQLMINNYITSDKYRQLIFDKELVEEMYGEGFYDLLHKKIKENGLIRESVPKNMILVEEKNDIKILKEDLTFLNELDFKRLRIISRYLSSECDINLVAKEFNISINSVVNVLNHPKNVEILKPQINIFVKDIGRFERILLEGEIKERKEIVDNIMTKLESNNYDINKTTQELFLPLDLVKRYLSEGFVSIYYPIEKIKDIFNTEENENKKGLK